MPDQSTLAVIEAARAALKLLEGPPACTDEECQDCPDAFICDAAKLLHAALDTYDTEHPRDDTPEGPHDNEVCADCDYYLTPWKCNGGTEEYPCPALAAHEQTPQSAPRGKTTSGL